MDDQGNEMNEAATIKAIHRDDNELYYTIRIHSSRSERNTTSDRIQAIENRDEFEEDDTLPDDVPENVRLHGESQGQDFEESPRQKRKFQTAAQHYSYRIM